MLIYFLFHFIQKSTMVVLSTESYNKIVDYIRNYKGLWMDCEDELRKKFPEPPLTLGSIFLTQKQNWMRQIHFTIRPPAKNNKLDKAENPKTGRPSRAEELLAKFEILARVNPGENGAHILRMAQTLQFSPLSLARKLLITKFPDCTKAEITEMIRNFDLIPDPVLALNVSFCVFNDNLEGGLSDIR